MQAEKKPEVWQRGPVDGVPALLQPVAHAILQAEEEIVEAVSNMPAEMLWSQPAGVASVGFHLKHITGVLDRLFTYADGQMLGQEQFEQLKMENITQENITAEHLLQALSRQVNITLGRLRTTKEKTLKDARGIGRQQIPTTVGGLLFHAAEHTMRHTGQLLVTAKMVKYSFGKN